MGDVWAPVVGIGVLTLSVATAVVLRGPIGKALADWIRSWSHTEQRWIEGKFGTGESATEVAGLRADVDALRQRLTEAEERLDFAERLLARTRDAGRLSQGRG